MDNHSTPKKFAVRRTNNPRGASLLLDFNLESPSDGMEMQLGQPVVICGWAVARGALKENLHLALRSSTATLAFPMNRHREDVVTHIKSNFSGEDAPLISGFLHDISPGLLGEETVLGFELDGSFVECYRIWTRE